MADKPRILLTTPWPERAVMAMQNHFEIDIHAGPLPMPEDRWLQALQTYDAIAPTVIDRIPAQAYRASENRTKVLGNFGVGYNHIDIEAARKGNLAVSNTPGVLTDATADQAMGLLLAVARGISLGDWHIRAGEWRGWNPTALLGTHVTGATLGIIGFGRIGQAMAKRAHFGFDMPVVFHNRSRIDEDRASALGARQLESIEAVLRESDFVSLHCPGGGENRHLINVHRLRKMKPTAFLINTARGDVVDESALAEALKNGTIAGAGLDVFEDEPRVHADLPALKNCVLNPHLGSATETTRTEMGLMVMHNLLAFFAKDPMPNAV
ncbi:MAG: D-glycerate dehydrogenase [Alphaproteobacteria bacterium TMED89]|nr:D-glycerate dehydrogenase [Rhodospirillaceae bacterium]RPH16892.1 MAG: D-glycerate dehydrogenase [Alphaproteobacteria bacterium TMED89]